MKNTGKKFETQFKKSLPDYCFYQRIPDPPQSFVQSKATRFSVKNPYDCIVYNTVFRILYCIELKTTKYKSMAFEDIYSNEKQDKMIHKHQILGLAKASEYNGVVAGFFLNFRTEKEDNTLERCYFIKIENFLSMCNNIDKKSFNEIDLINNGAIKVDGEKKRTNYVWDIEGLMNKIGDAYEN